MKTLVTIIAAILAAADIILVGILSWACDNWVMGVVTGIALAGYPKWVKESLNDNEHEHKVGCSPTNLNSLNSC